MVLVSGCLKSLSGVSQFSEEYRGGLKDYTFYDDSKIQECKLGECKCYACKNSTSWFGFRKSLVGGSCGIVSNCTPAKFNSIVNQSDQAFPDQYPLQFMVGQGYSFSSFGEANGWCGNRLDMPVQWLVGDNDSAYDLPEADRAVCFLEKEIIPMYVLYSKSTNVNFSQAKKIAEQMGKGGPSKDITGLITPGGGPVGPVIITTEIDFNSSDAEVVKNVTRQIEEINTGCGNDRTKQDPDDWEINCHVALAPKMGDTKIVNQILSDPEIKKRVDLIAFGVNAHLVDLNDTREQHCNPDIVFQKALAFARFSLYNHSKPTVIPYIMLDSKGTDLHGSCNWTESNMVDGYASLFKLHLLPLQKAGVIGLAAYDFNSSQFAITDPLGCQDCTLGKSKARMQAWFGSCRSYKILAKKYPAGDNMIMFSNESGGTCDYTTNPMGIFQMAYSNEFAAITPALTAPNETYLSCEACMNENFTFPFTVPSSSVVTAATNETYCKSVPSLDFYAGKRSLDPMLVRALVIAESTFEPCAAAKVYSDTSKNTRSIDKGCYAKGYDFVLDPDEGKCDTDVPNYVNDKPEYRYCAIGLMQTLIPPYTYWPSDLHPEGVQGDYFSGDSYSPKAQLYEEAAAKGRSGDISAVKAHCSPYFNPFNESHSACYGTYHLWDNVQTAEAIINKGNNKDKLHIKSANDERILKYYLALHLYRGYGSYIEQWIFNFDNRGKINPDFCAQSGLSEFDLLMCNDLQTNKVCYGANQKDFINYVRECEFHLKRNSAASFHLHFKEPFYGDYASRIMSYYKDLTENCANAACPSWKKLAQATCSNIPVGGIPDSQIDQCVKKPKESN
jgi:hypothetical protein